MSPHIFSYVGKDGVHTIIINTEDPKNSTRSGIIGTISEEGSHIIGKIEGRQIQTRTEEKGLESTGRATNEYFTDKYKKNDIPIKAKSDGKDYSNIDFGENVGDKANEGADYYARDLRNINRPNGDKSKYKEEEIQNNINWWFGKESYKIDWDRYEKDKEYREKTNYY